MDHNDIFTELGGQLNDFARRNEQPSYKIEVKIALRRALPEQVLNKLCKNFQNNGMEMDLDQRNHIIVDGIPPNYKYNAQVVLAEVRKVDDGAIILSEKIFK